MALDNKEIHFYVDLYSMREFKLGDYPLNSWEVTESAINEGDPVIHTTQIGLLSTLLWEIGYRTFIHEHDDVYEIKLGSNNTRTNRELRKSHNLFRMWVNGEFDIN